MEVLVADARPGIGKTSAAINYINESSHDERFLFITPFLSEGERIKNACPAREFVSPEGLSHSKLMDIKEQIREGRNIVSTHALFMNFDREIVESIEASGYTLIIDEAPNLVSECEVTPQDYNVLMERFVVADGQGKVIWTDEEYEGRYSVYKGMCELDSLYLLNNNKFIWMMSPNVFKAFRRVYIMTYLFDAQISRCYFDATGIPWRKIYIEGGSLDTYRFTEVPQKYVTPRFKELIHICDDEKLNKIGDHRSALSKNWFATTSDKTIVQLKNNVRNFFINKMRSKSGQNLWTTFKDSRARLSGKGYTLGFLPCNARATNEYRNRTYMAYAINIFPNPIYKQFFSRYGVVVHDDLYAVSEMVQWVWRSAIRDNKEVWLYVPSSRMRGLFTDWLNEVCTEGGENNG